jgi:hypothetical protein
MPDSALALGHESLRLRSRRVRSDRSHRLSVRFAVVLIVLASLAGFVGQGFRARAAAVYDTARIDQQTYLDLLWPIHRRLEQNVLGFGFVTAAAANPSTDPLDLTTRLDQGLASFRLTEEQVRALQPPADLRDVQLEYLDTLQLLQQAASEMTGNSPVGVDEARSATAISLGLDAATRLQRLCNRLWPVNCE